MNLVVALIIGSNSNAIAVRGVKQTLRNVLCIPNNIKNKIVFFFHLLYYDATIANE